MKLLKVKNPVLSKLEAIWILTDTGILVYSKVQNEKKSNQLIGTLLSAINTITETLSDGGMSSFETGNKRVNIIKKERFIFVSSYLKKMKQKKVMEELKKVSKKFLIKYSNKLIDWDSDISIFNDFEI